MLKLINVTKVFNPSSVNEKIAVKNLDFLIEDGEFVTIIGGNGSGKSTTLNLIAGTIEATSGSILLDDKDITKMSDFKRAKYISRVFQDPMMGTASDMSLLENLELAQKRGESLSPFKWGFKKDKRELYIEEIKKLDLGLENHLTQKVGLLSGGQRQAITLLMATLKKPKIILLDEHTAALDPKTAKKVLLLTDKLVKENHLTTIMITHNMKDAITYGNRLVMFHNGEIIYDVKGEEKQKLTVEELLRKFDEADQKLEE